VVGIGESYHKRKSGFKTLGFSIKVCIILFFFNPCSIPVLIFLCFVVKRAFQLQTFFAAIRFKITLQHPIKIHWLSLTHTKLSSSKIIGIFYLVITEVLPKLSTSQIRIARFLVNWMFKCKTIIYKKSWIFVFFVYFINAIKTTCGPL